MAISKWQNAANIIKKRRFNANQKSKTRACLVSDAFLAASVSTGPHTCQRQVEKNQNI